MHGVGHYCSIGYFDDLAIFFIVTIYMNESLNSENFIMRKLNYFSIILLSTFLITSCSMNRSIMFTPSASLNKPNFKIVKTVTGKAETEHILAFGGLNSRGLTNEAKADLYQNADLKENQTIANITLDSKTTFFFFFLYWKEQVYVSADVVEFFSDDIKVNNEKTNTVVNSQPSNIISQATKINSTEEETLISKEEKTLIKFLADNKLSSSKYSSADEVNKNDYVKIITDFGEQIFGKVVDASNPRKVKIKYYSPSHTPLIWEISWKELTKLTPTEEK